MGDAALATIAVDGSDAERHVEGKERRHLIGSGAASPIVHRSIGDAAAAVIVAADREIVLDAVLEAVQSIECKADCEIVLEAVRQKGLPLTPFGSYRQEIMVETVEQK